MSGKSILRKRIRRRVQYSTATLLWVTLVVASFFGGRQWERTHTEPETGRFLFGKGGNSDLGLVSRTIVDERGSR